MVGIKEGKGRAPYLVGIFEGLFYCRKLKYLILIYTYLEYKVQRLDYEI